MTETKYWRARAFTSEDTGCRQEDLKKGGGDRRLPCERGPQRVTQAQELLQCPLQSRRLRTQQVGELAVGRGPLAPGACHPAEDLPLARTRHRTPGTHRACVPWTSINCRTGTMHLLQAEMRMAKRHRLQMLSLYFAALSTRSSK